MHMRNGLIKSSIISPYADEIQSRIFSSAAAYILLGCPPTGLLEIMLIHSERMLFSIGL
jgi:hypothetical protein